MSQISDLPIYHPAASAPSHDESTSFICWVEGSTLFLIGEADAGTVNTLTACFEQAPAVGDINVDLAELTFLDLTALRVILRFRTELAGCGRSLTVVNPSPPASLLLRVTGLDRTLL